MTMAQIKHRIVAAGLVISILSVSLPARADFWGGDLAFLAQILAESIQEVTQLEAIIGTGRDSLNFMRDINEGLRNALGVMNTMNRSLKPGNMSNLNNVNEVMQQVQTLYGRVPVGSEAALQSTQDVTVAESLQLHNDAFRYADEMDPEAERIKAYAEDASPQGAARTQLQATSMLIHAVNQLLRTNAAVLKIQSENLAMQNRHSKMESEAFSSRYNEISKSLSAPSPSLDLPSLSGAP